MAEKKIRCKNEWCLKMKKKVVLSDKKSALQRFYLKVKQSSTRMVSL